MEQYRQRIADGILKFRLASKGAVLIEGPKWCGKTTTAEQVAASVLYMDDPAKIQQNLIMADSDPAFLLEGANPRLLDEWQLAPKLWDAVRFSVDHKGKFGLFILTGSAVPVESSEIKHTGTGRFSWIRMRPMSLFESGESNGTVSLEALFEEKGMPVRGTANLSLQDIAFLICRGGWPMSVGQPRKIALQQSLDYYDAVVNQDIFRVDGVKRDKAYVSTLMRSYARHQGAQASVSTIVKDMVSNESVGISDKTVTNYIKALQKIFVIEDMQAWNPNLRSKTAVRTADTRYFVDPSIATAALGIGPEDLLNDLITMGLFFETMAVRDLRVYAEAIDATVYHYRDRTELECDAVIHRRNGEYGLVEIKLGGDKLIEEGCSSLKKLQAKIDSQKVPVPSFMMVMTANGDFAYRRPDGILVVPIGALKV